MPTGIYKRLALGAGVATLAMSGLVAAGSRAQGVAKTVWDGLYTADQAGRGKETYTARCAACHGPSLGGGDSAPPLSGPAFLNNWNGTTSADLFNRIHDTMPVDEPGSLSGKQVSEIQAYIYQANGFPAGAAALPNDPQMMGGAKILAQKPGQ
ncbi:c-type cytochrome [Sphingomonas sp. CJ20]